MSIPAGASKHVYAGSLPVARPLYSEDLAELCSIDEALIRKSLEARPKNSNIAVAQIPDADTIRWHQAREEFVGNELHGKKPTIKGAIVGTEKGSRVWVYWTRVWYNENTQEAKGNTLHILRLVVEDEAQSSWERSSNGQANGHSAGHKHTDAIAALLLMAQREAEEWTLECVEAWNPSAATLAAAQKLDPGAELVERDTESIASLMWYPPLDKPVADSIDWIGNEKYGWN